MFELVNMLVEVELPKVELDDLIVPIEQAELGKVPFELVEPFEQGVELTKPAELLGGWI